MVKGKGYKKKLIILLAVVAGLFLLIFLNRNKIIKYLYQHRSLNSLVSKAAMRSGKQSKILNFNFPLNALDFFYSMGNISKDLEKKWFEVDLKIGSQNYSIEFSNFENHFKKLKLNNKNRSFTIRFAANDVVTTENEFNLFQANRIDFYEQELIYELARRLKIYTPNTEHVNVYVNYIDQGDYFLKQSFSKFFIEKSGIPDSFIFMLDKQKKGNWSTRFLLNEPKKEVIKNHFKQFLLLLRKKDANLLQKYFDLDYMARLELLRYLLAAETGFSIEDNIRFLCKKSNGKFYPILDESNIYNMQKSKKNKSFALISKQINGSRIIEERKQMLWRELAGNYEDILLKYRELTSKHLRLNHDFVFSLKLKLIAHYYLNHVYSKLNRKNNMPGNDGSQDQERLNRVHVPENYLDRIIISPASFIKTNKNLNMHFSNKRFVLKKGDYKITRDIIIPEGYSFDIQAGTRFRIAEGVSIISYSPVNILGTAKQPVLIQAQNLQSPFGIFAVHGNKEETCRITYLDFSGGSRAVINGVSFSNGLNFFNVNLEMRSSKIHHVSSDAGLSMVNGSVLMEGNEFYNNYSDQVTLEFCRGILRNNRFRKVNGDPNGDGLALAGSQVVVENNRFTDFQDKGISIGKKSWVILYNNIIRNNGIGVASKDSASVLLFKNKLYNNLHAVSAFQKNRIYEGGRCYVLNNDYAKNGKMFKVDKFSTFFELKNCPDIELKLAEEIKKGQINSLFSIFSQLMDKCVGPENKIEYFSVGKHQARIDNKKRIIFVNLPVGSGTRQTINYNCSVQGAEIYLNPVMVGINKISPEQALANAGKVNNNTIYDFKEYIFWGKISFHHNNRYDVYDLIVTTGNGAVIKIDTRDKRGKPRKIKDEPKIPCKFVLISPEFNRESGLADFQFYILDGKIEGRGQRWPKWKYGISFERSITISGLEPAKSWVLESSFVEKSLVRSKVAFDLLAQIQNNNDNDKKMKFALKSRFVEVILNDEYVGLYLLIQHINKNFLGLEKFDKKEPFNAVLYRSRDENANFTASNFITLKNSDYKFFPGQRQPEEKERDPILGWHSGFNQRHPNPDKYGEHWSPLEEFCKFTALSSDPVFRNRIFKLLDKNLFMDLWIFIELLDDHDGLFKNRYLARHKGNKSKWFFIPWDKDGVFGRSFNMEKRPHTEWLSSPLFNRAMKIKSFRDGFKKRWHELRKNGIIDKDNVFKMIEDTKTMLRDLQERNFRKWPTNHFYYPDKNNFEEEIKYMKIWIGKRILWLDKRIDDLDSIYKQP